MPLKPYIKINPSDNVAVALTDLKAGTTITINGLSFRVTTDIPAGHKFALQNFIVGAHIIKYGYPIGHVITPIAQGEWINEKHIKTNLEGTLRYTYQPQKQQLNFPARKMTFKGYRRSTGEAGVRNELWIIPTVGCVNGIAGQLAARLQKETGGKGLDAIVAFPHNYGCSQLGDDHENTRKILRNMALHPNAGAVLVLGLGCENNQLDALKTLIGNTKARIEYMETQKTDDEIVEGMEILRKLYIQTIQDKREDIPISELKIGLKCGGSDGFSGITANPLVGMFSDFLIAQNGSTVLTEVPEMFGAETILMNRSEDETIFNKTVDLINNFKAYFIANQQPVYENPSPGNKAGGISTLEEKSLGCTQKGGVATVVDVLPYGERIQKKGLNLLSAPGNDLVASTALAAAGCQIVLFTTGRGTPFGTFVPTLKIATNTPLYKQKPHWIDFNAGVIIDDEPIATTCERLIQYIIEVASGKEVNNEKSEYREIAIFKTGVTL